jgi:hypothetical protein
MDINTKSAAWIESAKAGRKACLAVHMVATIFQCTLQLSRFQAPLRRSFCIEVATLPI